MEIITENLNEDQKKEYVIVVGLDPAYYIQYKIKGLIILNFKKVAIFIYRPRPIDIPKIMKLEHFEEFKDQ